MGVLTDVRTEDMATAGNSKAAHPIVTGLVVGLVVGVIQVAVNQWANRSGSNDDLVAVRTEVAGMRKQLDRIETRDLVPRSEFDRAITRFEDRLRELERQVQSRQQDNNR